MESHSLKINLESVTHAEETTDVIAFIFIPTF